MTSHISKLNKRLPNLLNSNKFRMLFTEQSFVMKLLFLCIQIWIVVILGSNASAEYKISPLSRYTIFSWFLPSCNGYKEECFQFTIVEGIGIVAEEKEIKSLGRPLRELPKKIRTLSPAKIWWNSGWNESDSVPIDFQVPVGLPIYNQVLKEAQEKGSKIILTPGDI